MSNPTRFAVILTETSTEAWTASWPDAVAFAIGLAVAWWARWSAGDLIWSLWLSSFVVGYTTIVWMIAQPAAELASAAWRERSIVRGDPQALTIFALLLLGGVAFFLGFFTIHFGGFHYVHSQILIYFFPIEAGHGRSTDATMATYVEIARRYWPFLPSAFIAHRAAFLRKPLSIGSGTSIAAMRDSKSLGALFTEPYRNVMRMHILLFFFFFAHFAGLENFAVYAVIYAVYFFPWRLLRRGETSPTVAATG